MNRLFNYVAAVAAVLALGLTSCKSDDDDDFEPVSEDVKALVSADVPAQGWSGDAANGVFKYAPAEYYDDEPNSYFAFNMKNGVCESAVLNMVMPNAAQARQLAQMLNNGTWVNGYDDDDDDDDDDYYNASARIGVFDMTGALVRHAVRIGLSRAGSTLPIPVGQDGKVIFITLPNLKGISAEDIKKVIDLWSGTSSQIPDRVLFGEYSDGVYSCKNMHGMNIDYLIETGFNASGFCTKYTTSITLPTESWAQYYYDELEAQMWDFESQFGQSPDLTINGRTVVLEAIIIGDVTADQIDSMIFAIDWANNCPFLYGLF